MRIRVNLHLERRVAVPVNHQHYLTAVVYQFLEQADADYARFLHDDGYAPTANGAANGMSEPTHPERRRFKLFTFSSLRADKAHRRVEGERLWLGPGEAHWLVSSPVPKFLTEFATGLLQAGTLRVGSVCLPVTAAETLPSPDLGEEARFTCLSPIVAAVGSPDQATPAYLRPGDERFSEQLRRNLIAKYSALYGKAPEDTRLMVTWDADYLRTHRGTKVVHYKGIGIAGAFCPLTLSGSTPLLEIAYDAGLGEKNAAGFGMIEVVK